MAKSTACRMLAALAAGGMLERTGSGRYRLGLRLFEIGQLAVDRLMLRELALPVLGELREVLRETAQLAVPVGADVLYVDRLESSGAGTMFHTELYRRGPGHSSSAGKAMAAFNPTMERAILARGFTRRTPFTIVDPARYRQVLRQVRIDGVAASREEHTMGLSSVAAPIVVPRGERQRGGRGDLGGRRHVPGARAPQDRRGAERAPGRGAGLAGARPLVSAQPC